MNLNFYGKGYFLMATRYVYVSCNFPEKNEMQLHTKMYFEKISKIALLLFYHNLCNIILLRPISLFLWDRGSTHEFFTCRKQGQKCPVMQMRSDTKNLNKEEVNKHFFTRNLIHHFFSAKPQRHIKKLNGISFLTNSCAIHANSA